MGDKDMLSAAIRCVSGELAERPFRLAGFGQDLALDDNLRASWDLDLANAAARDAIGLAEQTSDDFRFPHVWRVGVHHRAHIMQRMRPNRDRGGERLSLFL